VLKTGNRGIAGIAAVFLILALAVILSQADSPLISPVLEYGNNLSWDPDNDGVEGITGTIDMTVEQSSFGDLSEDRMCTLWNATLLDFATGLYALTCSGDEPCCNVLFNLTAAEGDYWNSPMTLTYRKYYGGEEDSPSYITNHNYSVKATLAFYNSSFNTSATSNSLEAEFFDDLSPEITVISPLDGGYSNPNLSVGFTIEDDSDIARCCIIVDGGSSCSYAIENGENTITAQSLSDGQHTWQLNCSDVWGNEEITPEYAVTVVSQAPLIKLGSPAEGEFLLEGGRNIIFTVNSSLSTNCTMTIARNGETTYSNLFVSAGLGPQSQGFTLGHGNYTINITCTDQVSNRANITRNFRVSNISLSLNKEGYELNEPVVITVSPLLSKANLTITRQDLLNNVQPTFSEITSELINFTKTQFAGEYVINISAFYDHQQINLVKLFSISNSLSPRLTTEKSVYDTWEGVLFTLNASGGTEPYSFDLSFGDGANTTTTESYVSHAYERSGSFEVRLSVKDKYGNVNSIVKSVKALNPLLIITRENGTDALLNSTGIEVSASSIEFAYTNSSGLADLKLREGWYNLTATKSGYLSNRVEFYINKSMSITVYLTKITDQDTTPPGITLTSPDNNAQQNTSLRFSFRASDNSVMSCTLQTKSTGDWTDATGAKDIASGSETSFDLTLNPGTYTWRVKCSDAAGNTGYSGERTLTVAATELVELAQIDSSQDSEILRRVDELITHFSTIGEAEGEVVDELDISNQLDRYKFRIQTIQRDLNSLEDRQLSDDERERERSRILTQLEEVKQEIPSDIRVLQKKELTAYPTREEINNLSAEYAAIVNTSSLRRNPKAFADRNNQLQNMVTITAKVIVVEVSYLFRETETISLVIKRIKTDADPGSASLVDFIPKDIAQDADEIKFITEPRILKKDPVVEFDLKDDGTIKYVIKKAIDPERISELKSLAVVKDIKDRNIAITGWPIATIATTASILGLDPNDRRQVSLFILVILLVLGYIMYQFAIPHRLSELVLKSKKKMAALRQIAIKAEEAVNDKNWEKASMFYIEMKLIYETLPETHRDAMYERLAKIADSVNFGFVEQTAKAIEHEAAEGNMEKARQLYAELADAYERLTPEYKKKIAKWGMDIYWKLQREGVIDKLPEASQEAKAEKEAARTDSNTSLQLVSIWKRKL